MLASALAAIRDVGPRRGAPQTSGKKIASALSHASVTSELVDRPGVAGAANAEWGGTLGKNSCRRLQPSAPSTKGSLNSCPIFSSDTERTFLRFPQLPQDRLASE